MILWLKHWAEYQENLDSIFRPISNFLCDLEQVIYFLCAFLPQTSVYSLFNFGCFVCTDYKDFRTKTLFFYKWGDIHTICHEVI